MNPCDPHFRRIHWIISKIGYFGSMIRSVSLLKIRNEYPWPAVARNKLRCDCRHFGHGWRWDKLLTSLFGFRKIDEQCLCTFFAAESRPSFWYNSYGQEWYTTPPASFDVPGSSVTANQSSSTSSYSSEMSEVSETEPSVKTRWSRPEVLQLLSVFSAKRQRFKDINVKDKTVWEEISTALNKNGVSCTAKMCETKIKNLKRSYVSCVDHKKKSGSGIKGSNEPTREWNGMK